MHLPSTMSENGDLASGNRSKLLGVITMSYKEKATPCLLLDSDYEYIILLYMYNNVGIHKI